MKYNSSFWYNDFETDDIIINNLSDTEKKSLDLYKLASSKRAISNFVNIVTNESIPVKFKERGDSYTDGKSVVIGSKIEQPKDFDVAVGLALHEGSHIKLSDFKLLNDLYNLIPTHISEGLLRKVFTLLKKQLRTFGTMLRIEELITSYSNQHLVIEVIIERCTINTSTIG